MKEFLAILRTSGRKQSKAIEFIDKSALEEDIWLQQCMQAMVAKQEQYFLL